MNDSEKNVKIKKKSYIARHLGIEEIYSIMTDSKLFNLFCIDT